jgi:hypothetical protein
MSIIPVPKNLNKRINVHFLFDVKQHELRHKARCVAGDLITNDIATAVTTLGRFRVAPHVGLMDRLKRVCGYLRKYPDSSETGSASF